MNVSKSFIAAAALLVSVGASAGAQVTASAGGPIGPFLSLSTPGNCSIVACSLGGIATINRGSIFATDLPFADIPAGAVHQNRFLSSGPSSTSPATMTFNAPVSGISFLWGSPDTYNVLQVVAAGPSENIQSFFASDFGFTTTGDQNYSRYVTITADAGFSISQLIFSNNPSTDAFEVANFSIQADGAQVVPEPASFALVAAGLFGLGAVARRRRNV